jgi:hypothetical protein
MFTGLKSNIILLTLLLAGCAAGAYSFPKGYLPAPAVHDSLAAEPMKVVRVFRSAFYPTRDEWVASPYYRIGDGIITLPVKVLIDYRHRACLVPDQIFAMQPREIACPRGWRTARLRRRP